MSRTYSIRQWIGLIAITVSAIAFAEIQAGLGGESPKREKNLLFGYSCSVLASLSTVVAGLFSERFLKSKKDTPFYTQKVQIELGGLCFACAMLWFMPWLADAADLAMKDSLAFFSPRTEYECNGVTKTLWGKQNSGNVTPVGCRLVAQYHGRFFDGWSPTTWL